MHTTNSTNLLIEIAEDSSAVTAQIPPVKTKKTVANLQYEMIANHPYEYTSDEVMFAIFAIRKEIPSENMEEQRHLFFSKGQPCFRASPLTKRYGWGVHHNADGKIALHGVDSDIYQQLVVDESVVKKKAMRSKRR